jgi:hypothetical protein
MVVATAPQKRYIIQANRGDESGSLRVSSKKN